MKAWFVAIWSTLVLLVLFSNSITATGSDGTLNDKDKLTDEEIDTLLAVLILLFDNEESVHFGKKISELRDLDFVISGEKAGRKYDSFQKSNQVGDRSTVLELWKTKEHYMDAFKELFPGNHMHTADELVARLTDFDVETVQNFAFVVFVTMGCKDYTVHISNFVAFLNAIRSGDYISEEDASEIWKKINLNKDVEYCHWVDFKNACTSIENLAKICRADETIVVQPLVI